MSSAEMTPSAILAALKDFADPESGRGAVEMGQIRDVKVADNRISIVLALTTMASPLWEETRQECATLLRQKFPSAADVSVQLAVHERKPLPLGEIGVTAKCVIAVGSGKGGVGKSTIAASLAYGLHLAGAKVGLMDADVYGPSVPHLIGVNHRPEVLDGKIQPIDVDGMKVMSIGFLVPANEAVVWRGPMLHGAIQQFLRDTAWGDLDYLIIDMPPGTGDIALTLSQLLPLTGAVIVCTPQDVALLDAVKAIAMFRKVNIPVLGMVENMSYFICPDNGKQYDIFGHGGAKKRAGELEIPFLGEVPINIQLRVRGDEGRIAGNFSDETTSPYLKTLCHNLVKNLATARREHPPLPSLSVLR